MRGLDGVGARSERRHDVEINALAHRIQRLLGCEAVWPKGAVDRAPISSGFENNEGQALGVVFLI